MAGAETVQGQNPQALGLDPILAAIQSQYTPQTFTQSGGSYGAGRFIDDGSSVAGVGSNLGGNVAPSWFKQGDFDLASFQKALPSEVVNKISTGDLYGGEGESAVGNVGNQAWMDDPYSGLFNQVPNSVMSLFGRAVPFAGLALGAAQGYSGATAANALQADMEAWGGQPNVAADPVTSALMGAFGQTPEGLENALGFASNFADSAAMVGYMDAVSDPSVQAITDAVMTAQLGQTSNSYSANEYGVTAASISNAIESNVASGMTKGEAVQSVALEMGVPASYAATLSANLNTQDPIGALIANLEASTPAAIASQQAQSLQNALNAWTESETAAAGVTDAPYGGSVTDGSGGVVTDSSGNPIAYGEGHANAAAADAASQAAAEAAYAEAAAANAAADASASSGNVSIGGQAAASGSGHGPDGATAPDAVDAPSGDGGGDGDGSCVIATHAVNSGNFTKREKQKAVVWCVKTLHNRWWGESIRRGYRFYGNRAIKSGEAHQYYDEFRDFVRFATGTKRNAKTAKTFLWRSVQFFVTGLFLKED